MITTGIDFAAQDASIAACTIDWEPSRFKVSLVEERLTDDVIIGLISREDNKTGIDVPFGWPVEFVKFVCSHRDGSIDQPWSAALSRSLRLRATDRFVYEKTGASPLSVSSNLIAIPAMRAACLLGSLAANGRRVDRTGVGSVCEVYPAAALRRWGLWVQGYKDPAATRLRGELLRNIETQSGIEFPQAVVAECEASHDALDAVIAALVARVAHLGLCEQVPPAEATLAQQEGWIALPNADSLQLLM